MAKDLYSSLKECCSHLESEIQRQVKELNRIESFHENHLLEDAKDFHYKEIIKTLNEIKHKIDFIKYHEAKVQSLNTTKMVPVADLRNYSYVQRQVKAFSNPDLENTKTNDETVVKLREKRSKRMSDISIKSLDIWDKLLEDYSSDSINDITVAMNEVPKRLADNNRARKKKKFVSSTCGEFLNDDFDDSGSECSFRTCADPNSAFSTSQSLMSINEYEECIEPIIDKEYSKQYSKSLTSLNEADEDEEFLFNRNVTHHTVDDLSFHDTKPRIVELILKKTTQ